MPSVEQLKQRLAQHLKAKRIEGALSALSLLEREDPGEPTWPRRTARLLRAQADAKGELAALRRALELQVDQGLVLEAIASCQTILELAPEDSRTVETLDLLYMDGPPADAALPSAAPAGETSAPPALGPSSVPSGWGEASDEPLDSLILTDVVPGARAVANDGAASVSEIPIDLEDAVDASDDRGASLRGELANIPLFGDLDLASLHKLVRRVRAVTLEPRQVLFRQGDPANSLYVVVEGAVVPIAEGDRRCKLAVLERGAFFGEIGLMTKQPRNATIEALVETKLLAIDRRLLRQLIGDAPSVTKSILRFLRARLIDRQIRTNPFFSAFAHGERAAVAKQFRFLEVEDGAKLIERGRAPDGLYVVLSGELGVVGPVSPDEQDEDKHLAGLGLGDAFGGLSLIDGRLPPGDVVARGKCWLVVLYEGRFRRILEANPRLEKILRRIAQEVVESSASGQEGALVR